MAYGKIEKNENSTRLINELKQNAQKYEILNKKQEHDLIKKYKNDRDALNEQLFNHNIRLVFNMSKKYATKVADFDSMISDGLYGLSLACQRFDTSRNIKFSTFCVPYIFKYLVSHFYSREYEMDKRSTSLDTQVDAHTSKSSEHELTTLENVINDKIDPAVDIQTIHSQLSSNEMRAICNSLTKTVQNDSTLSAMDKGIFMDSFYDKMKIKDIAEKYNIRPIDVTKIKTKILMKLKEILHKEYNVNSFYDVHMV